MGHTIDWLLGNNNLSAEKMAYYQYKFMPEELKNAFQVVHATPGGIASKKNSLTAVRLSEKARY